MYHRWFGALGYALLFNLVAVSCFVCAMWTARPFLWGVVGFTIVIGTAIGSFLTLAIYRVPRRMSLNLPPSSCPQCGHLIRARHNIPVLGWLILGGRCADCREPIPVRYPLFELFAGLVSGLCSYLVLR